MKKLWSTAAIAACMVALSSQEPAQTPPLTVLEVDLENSVMYFDDVSDQSKWATVSSPVPLAENFNMTFKWRISIADISAVNGRPVKSNYVILQRGIRATTDLTPGRVIADFANGCLAELRYIFLQPDGTLIGSLVASGSSSSVPPPGAPAVAADTTYLNVVVGGTGPFLGARGQATITGSSRMASIVEDPACRRANGGGKVKHFITLDPHDLA
jgi:hypothetical protein